MRPSTASRALTPERRCRFPALLPSGLLSGRRCGGQCSLHPLPAWGPRTSQRNAPITWCIGCEKSPVRLGRWCVVDLCWGSVVGAHVRWRAGCGGGRRRTWRCCRGSLEGAVYGPSAVIGPTLVTEWRYPPAFSGTVVAAGRRGCRTRAAFTPRGSVSHGQPHTRCRVAGFRRSVAGCEPSGERVGEAPSARWRSHADGRCLR